VTILPQAMLPSTGLARHVKNCAGVFRFLRKLVWQTQLRARPVFPYGMAERQLIILRHLDQTPVLAGCSSCELKFFSPSELMKDPNEARSYLLSKFDEHVCRIADGQTKTLPRNRWFWPFCAFREFPLQRGV
jgi:hypothetical protein